MKNRGEALILGLESGASGLKGVEINKKIFSAIRPEALLNKKILILCEDNTRRTPINSFFEEFADTLIDKGAAEITVVFAVGSHTKMTEEEMIKKLGLTKEGIKGRNIKLLNHDHKADDLIQVGELEGQPLEVNSEVGKADTVITLNNCLPHKVVGFSGGSKMIFPGISGERFRAHFHSKQEREQIPDDQIEGLIHNPIRNLLDDATDQLQEFFPEKNFISASLVTSPDGGIADVFTGSFRDSYEKAATLSKDIYMKEIEEPLDEIVAYIDPNKSDLWQAMQALYNCAGVLRDGGTIVISGALAKAFGGTHWQEILEFGGYADEEELKKRIREGKKVDDTVFSHMMRIAKFISRGIQIKVSSENLTEDQCIQMGLGYLAPELLERETPDVIVHHATDMLLQKKAIV